MFHFSSDCDREVPNRLNGKSRIVLRTIETTVAMRTQPPRMISPDGAGDVTQRDDAQPLMDSIIAGVNCWSVKKKIFA
jgi:hypothetical protein